MNADELIRSKHGLIATVSLTGSVKSQFAAALGNLRSHNDRNSIHGVEYRFFNAVLVESGRDACVVHALKERYDWLLQIDADAAPFPANALEHLLTRAYITHPYFDIIGAYANLKGGLNLPTIDTGSGTWEEHYPGEGVIPVIRTGAHFLFTKTDVFRRFGPPWFRSRLASSPLAAMREVDNFARIKLDGVNPLAQSLEWPTLLAEAARVGNSESSVGEDSGFCDRAKAAGLRIAVDTDLIIGHVEDRTIMPEDFAKTVKERRANERMALGVME